MTIQDSAKNHASRVAADGNLMPAQFDRLGRSRCNLGGSDRCTKVSLSTQLLLEYLRQAARIHDILVHEQSAPAALHCIELFAAERDAGKRIGWHGR